MAIIKSYNKDVFTSTITALIEVDSVLVSAISHIDEEESFSELIRNINYSSVTSLYHNGATLLPLPTQPQTHSWDWATFSWKDTRTISEIQSDLWLRIKSDRENALSAPLTTPFGVFDAGRDSQKSITDAIMMLQTLASIGTPTTIDFTLSNNSEVTLNTSQMIQVGLLLGQRTQQIYSISRSLRTQVISATSNTELDGITWSFGT